jgi:hypothetical protein
MKRVLITAVLLIALASLSYTSARQGAKKQKPPCATDLAHCGDAGCGGKFDPNLNRKKNIRTDNDTPTPRTLTWVKKLDDPENFEEGGSRDELESLGEGQMVSVVAYVLVVRDEPGGESCNCGLHSIPETDNHMVLVTKTTIQKFPFKTPATAKTVLKQREAESITAEFTPRVRQANHPNFVRKVVQPLIDKTPQKALLARITGTLLFDSEHFIRNHLLRVNNWEIHPVFKFEFCQTGDNCKVSSDTGWKSIDDLP